MNIYVNIKKASGKTIEKKEYALNVEEAEITMGDFLALIVRSEVQKFNEEVMSTKDANPDEGYEYLDKASVLKVFSKEDIEDQAASGKISFDVKYNRKLQDEEDAINNAIQCFKDGVVAVFIGDTRYEEINDKVTIKEGTEVTFVRLTFLAGRMW